MRWILLVNVQPDPSELEKLLLPSETLTKSLIHERLMHEQPRRGDLVKALSCSKKDRTLALTKL